mgnify:CR=1 FL=1
MRNSTAYYLFVLFINYQAYPILPNADLILSRKSSHLLKVSEIVWILTYERFKDDLLSLSLDTFREFGKLFQKTLFIFNFPHFVSDFHRSVWLLA